MIGTPGGRIVDVHFGWPSQSTDSRGNMLRPLLKLSLSTFTLSLAFAQDSRGTISGRALDPSGASLPAVRVRAVSTGTGAAVEARTNDAGNYTLPFLLPGFYDVTAEVAGFQKLDRKGVEVRVNDNVTVDLRMTIGDVTQSLEVNAATPLLETGAVSLGQVVDRARLVDLPIQSGNPAELAKSAPGSVSISSLGIQKAAFNNGLSQMVTNGNTAYSNEFMIDGVPNTFSEGNLVRIAFSPPQGALSEFKSQTTSYDASLGHTPGAVVNMITASGTSKFHGEIHEFWGGSGLDTATLFQNRARISKIPYSDNRYGGSLGGPLRLPRHSGNGKTFFFYTYEANKWRTPNVNTLTVPTAAEKAGDFSQLLRVGAQYQIFDPFSTTSTGSGHYSRQAYAGNMLPAARLNPVALNMAKFWPTPTQTGGADGTQNFTTTAASTTEDYYAHFLRVDHNFSERNRIFVRLDYDWWAENKYTYFPNLSSGILTNRYNRGLALDDVFVISPTTVLNIRYGLTEQDHPEQQLSTGADLTGLGFSSNLVNLVPREQATLPALSLGTFQGFGQFDSGNGANTSMVHDMNVGFTTLRGNHQFSYGGDYRLYRAFQIRQPFGVAPAFAATTTYTKASDTSGSSPLGQDLAAFLLGVPEGQMQRAASFATQEQFFALYLQDQWKLTRRLTVTLGMRIEHETPVTERFDRAVKGFDNTTVNPISAQATANYGKNPIAEIPIANFRVLGGLRFAGGSNGRSLWSGQGINPLPRAAATYQVDSRTVVRAGYGIFYDTIGTNRSPAIQTGFTASTPMIASFDSGITYAATLTNPFPNGLLAPTGSSTGLATFLGQALSVYPVDRVQPYSQRWSFGLQREMPAGFLVNATYVGNHAVRLQINRELNYTNPAYLSTSPVRDASTIGSLTQSFPNPFFGLNSVYTQNISRAQLLTPYPQFGSIQEMQPIGRSIYHSLQTQVQKRFTSGFTINLAHTWSKLLDATTFLNPSSPTPWYGISPNDRPSRLVVNGLWELPIGKGRMVSVPGWLERGISGIQLAGHIVRQSGAPIEWGNVIFNGNINDIALPKDQRSPDHWINVNAGFNKASAAQLANNLRSFPLRFAGIRGDGQATWNFSAIKNIVLRESVKFQLRADSFNALNHPNFNAVNASPTSTAFGTIASQNGGGRQITVAGRLTF